MMLLLNVTTAKTKVWVVQKFKSEFKLLELE